MTQHELVCISCPVGCALTVNVGGTDSRVTGNQCRLGAIYGIKEVTNPRRMITTSVKVYYEEKTAYQLLSVKTDGDVPKEKMSACVAAIKEVQLQGDIQVGEVVIKNVLNLGVDVVATRPISF